LKAIISDLHGNLAALRAVLADIQAKNIDEIICLGDVVGYGPNPRECLDLAADFALTIQGNHDEAIFLEPRDFNVRAEMALEWTRDRLFEDESSKGNQRLQFLQALPKTHANGSAFLVHGSPRKPVREYIFPRDVTMNRGKMTKIFELIQSHCFVGHTHLPGVFTQDFKYYHPADLLKGIYLLDPKQKAVINVGSVGQPRDEDPRASYATFDGDAVVFRRVEYDVEETVRQIYEASGLDNSLADRLKVGL